MGIEVLVQRYTPAAPWRQRVAPLCFFGRKIQNGKGARRSGKEMPSVIDRILSREMGHFVQKALDDEDVVRGTNTAPPVEFDGRIVANPVHPDRLEIVRRIPGAIDSVFVELFFRPAARVEILADRA